MSFCAYTLILCSFDSITKINWRFSKGWDSLQALCCIIYPHGFCACTINCKDNIPRQNASSICRTSWSSWNNKKPSRWSIRSCRVSNWQPYTCKSTLSSRLSSKKILKDFGSVKLPIFFQSRPYYVWKTYIGLVVVKESWKNFKGWNSLVPANS